MLEKPFRKIFKRVLIFISFFVIILRLGDTQKLPFGFSIFARKADRKVKKETGALSKRPKKITISAFFTLDFILCPLYDLLLFKSETAKLFPCPLIKMENIRPTHD